LLLHGSDFIDHSMMGNSGLGRLITNPSNGVTLTPSPFPIGGNAFSFDGSHVMYGSSASSDDALGTGEFGIELFFKCTAWGSSINLLVATTGPSNGWEIYIYSGGLTMAYYHNGGTAASLSSANSLVTLNSLHHVFVGRDVNTLRIHLDGAQVASSDITGTSFDAPTVPITFANRYSANGTVWNTGLIQEYRTVKGTCPYRGGTTFAVPTIPFGPDAR